jgi:hypothetical protein
MGHCNKRLMPASTPLSHRIEGEVAESATADFTPIIESADEAHRMQTQAAAGVLPSTEGPYGGKSRQMTMKVRDSRD